MMGSPICGASGMGEFSAASESLTDFPSCAILRSTRLSARSSGPSSSPRNISTTKCRPCLYSSLIKDPLIFLSHFLSFLLYFQAASVDTWGSSMKIKQPKVRELRYTKDGQQYQSYQVVWSDRSGKRQRKQFTDRSEAALFASETHTQLLNDGSSHRSLSTVLSEPLLREA